MDSARVLSPTTVSRDLTAGLVVFLVALPLCLGVALASGAPLISGVVAGVLGGVVVGLLSGSQVSVSGPAAGITAVVTAQVAQLGSFEAFLLALIVGGVIQVLLGVARVGFIAAFIPSSVIKGLLAAIGVILILKQLPHLVGHDTDPEGEMQFLQPDDHNTFSELGLLGDMHLGAAAIGLASIVVLVLWDRSQRLKGSVVPAPLAVVLLGVVLSLLFKQVGGLWEIPASHLVQMPVAESLGGFFSFLTRPDFSHWSNPAIYLGGLTIAMVASLDTLLNLEATDKLDRRQRVSPPSRELIAQGVANIAAGLIGGIPVTAGVIRGSVNINAGAETRLATIVHGLLLLVCVVLLPTYLNLIPLSCLAAILLVTGIKLVSPSLIRQMWLDGRYQFIPFAATLVAIVFTDLVTGILIGLGVSLAFILNSNLRRPVRRIVEKHLGGEVLHIELANQVSFLNRASLEKALRSAPRGTHVLLDAHGTDYIDPDILALIREFKDRTAPVRGVQVSLRGFRTKYQLQDQIQYVDYSTRELQDQVTPTQVLHILREGNQRFRQGRRLTRDLGRQLDASARGQHPLAVVLSCIDSRTPGELIFDLGLGDIFSVRVAGNIISPKMLGSLEYGCAVAGAKLILVMGHTRCGAVSASVKLASSHQNVAEATGCQHLAPIVDDIQRSIDAASLARFEQAGELEQAAVIDAVARRNVLRSVRAIVERSDTISGLVRQGKVAVVGAVYDVTTGEIEFMTGEAFGLTDVGAIAPAAGTTHEQRPAGEANPRSS